MKIYGMKGYVKYKGKEDQDWEKLKENLAFKLPDDIEPYQAVCADFKRIASYWLILLNELTDNNEEEE